MAADRKQILDQIQTKGKMEYFTGKTLAGKHGVAEYRAIVDVSCSVRKFYFKKAKWNQGPPEKDGIPGQ